MANPSLITIEILYASTSKQVLLTLTLPTHTTIEQAINQSGILKTFPEIDLTKQKVGVFSKQRALSDEVSDGDRIEIYRPLTVDPKEARRTKAKLNKKLNRDR